MMTDNIRKRKDGYYFPDPHTGEATGPYDTKAEAQSDLKGLRNFYTLIPKEDKECLPHEK